MSCIQPDNSTNFQRRKFGLLFVDSGGILDR